MKELLKHLGLIFAESEKLMQNDNSKKKFIELVNWLKPLLLKITNDDKLINEIEKGNIDYEYIEIIKSKLEKEFANDDDFYMQLNAKIKDFINNDFYKEVLGKYNAEKRNNIVNISDISAKGDINIRVVHFGELIDEYKALRNELNKLASVELSIKDLLELRETSGYKTALRSKKKDKNKIIKKNLMYGFDIIISNHIENSNNEYQQYTFDTSDIVKGLNIKEKKLYGLEKVENGNDDKSNQELKKEKQAGDDFKQSMLIVSRELEKRKHHLRAILIQISSSVSQTSVFFENMVDRIKHEEYKEQAKIHQKASENLTEKLNKSFKEDILMESNSYILQTIGVVGIMIDTEKRRIAIERLVSLDKYKKQLTIWTVIGYLLLVISILITFNSYLKPYLPSNEIFLSVLLWSIFGSVASMVLKFNQNPINNFGDAVKWLITRPIQGVIFGAAIYLVIVAGQFVFSGSVEQTGIIQKNSEFVLLIAFLVGFSDRFALNVFNNLIERYPGNQKNGTLDTKNHDIEEN